MTSPYAADTDALGTSAHFVTYAGAVADTNLGLEGNGPCRRIRCAVAGDLHVKRASDNTEVVLKFLAGETQFVSALALVAAGSTATDVTVYF